MDSVETTPEIRKITAEAEQKSGWWTAQATNEELPPATARSLTSVTTQLKKIAADLLGVAPESIDLSVSTELPDDVQQLVDQADQQRATAEAATSEARNSLHAAAVRLKEAGWLTRDIASRLRLSTKTVTTALAPTGQGAQDA